MKRDLSIKYLGRALILISAAACGVFVASFRELDALSKIAGVPISVELKISAYFIGALGLLVGIGLCFWPSKFAKFGRNRQSDRPSDDRGGVSPNPL